LLFIAILKGEKTAIDVGIDFIRAIMLDYQDASGDSGMKVLYNVPDLECGTVKNVILRQGITEPFWNRVIETSEPPPQPMHTKNFGNATEPEQQSTDTSLESSCHDDESNEEEQGHVEATGRQHRVCVVGSTGVGKTTTTAVFIRSLLLRGTSVVYHIRTTDKSRWVYEFIPNTKDVEYPYNIEVKVIQENEFNPALTPTLVDNTKSYYIVDSGTTFDGNCNPDQQIQCRVVLITSPDERQWGGTSFTMLRGGKTSGTFLYYPSWTLPELLLSHSLMIPSTNDSLTNDMVRERFNEVGGIPGHILATSNAYRHIIAAQLHNVLTLSEQQLKLMIRNYWQHMGYFNTIVGYAQNKDGNDLFSSAIARPVSLKVFESICTVHDIFLWHQLRSQVVDVAFANAMLGVWFRQILIGAHLCTFSYRDAMNDKDDTVSAISLGGCNRSEISYTDIVAAATETENVVFYTNSIASSNLVDFAYRNGDDYYLFVCNMERHCLLDMNRFKEIKNATATSEECHVHYYYVVPSFNFETFTVTTKPDQLTNDTKIRGIGVLRLCDTKENQTTGTYR
jgi:hypothetical protein